MYLEHFEHFEITSKETHFITSGAHEQLSLLLLKLGVSCNVNEDTSLAGIKCLIALLNYVMGVVKKALQVRDISFIHCSN